MSIIRSSQRNAVSLKATELIFFTSPVLITWSGPTRASRSIACRSRRTGAPPFKSRPKLSQKDAPKSVWDDPPQSLTHRSVSSSCSLCPPTELHQEGENMGERSAAAWPAARHPSPHIRVAHTTAGRHRGLQVEALMVKPPCQLQFVLFSLQLPGRVPGLLKDVREDGILRQDQARDHGPHNAFLRRLVEQRVHLAQLFTRDPATDRHVGALTVLDVLVMPAVADQSQDLIRVRRAERRVPASSHLHRASSPPASSTILRL